MHKTDTPLKEQCAQATVEALCASTLAHYDDISAKACHWNNQVPQAIKFWYLEKPRLERDRADLIAMLQQLFDSYCSAMSSEFDFPGKPWTPERYDNQPAIQARMLLARALLERMKP